MMVAPQPAARLPLLKTLHRAIVGYVDPGEIVMPQHLHRRDFLQASAAAAAAITAAGLPGAARAAAWTTIDAQVHAYERNHPGRPWAGTLVGPAEMTGDQMVVAMDAVGVDGAVLVSPFSMYRYDPSYVLEVVAKHPDPLLPSQTGRSERSCRRR